MERPWYGPLSPWITDAEKNEAVNRMEHDLKVWRARQREIERKRVTPAPTTQPEDR